MQQNEIIWANIAVTYLCNSFCKRCNIWKIYKTDPDSLIEELKIEKIKETFSNSIYLKNIRIFNLTGGEPWLKNDFVELTSFLINKYPNSIFIVPTNAINIDIVLKKLRLISNNCSLKYFQLAISLDGIAEIHESIRGVKGNYTSVLKLIERMKTEFPQVGLNISFTGGPENYKEINSVYQLANKLQVEFGCQLVQSSNNYYKNDDYKISWNENQINTIKDSLNLIIEKFRENNGPQFNTYFLEHITEFALNPKRMVPCYSAKNSFFLDPYGNVYPCILLDKIIGNIKERSFDDIWDSAETKEVRQFISLNQCSCWTPCESMPSLFENIHVYERAIQIKDNKIATLRNEIQSKNTQIVQHHHSYFYRFCNKQQLFTKVFLPIITKIRHYHNLVLKGLEVISDEGWKRFISKTINYIFGFQLKHKNKKIESEKYTISFLKKELSGIKFPSVNGTPLLSIIIIMKPSVEHIIKNLKSILENTSCNYEIIAIDDSLGEQLSNIIQQISNLAYIKKEGFGDTFSSLNEILESIHGRYTIFLDSETILTKNWLDPLLNKLNDNTVGAIGCKLVGQNEILQEAGGIVWYNGDILRYGYGDQANKPEYNYVREVDYCSSYALLIRYELLKDIVGFNDDYNLGNLRPVDLCFSIRKRGYKVIYNPFSTIIHLEEQNLPDNTISVTQQYKEKFIDKWNTVLVNEHYKNTLKDVFRARDKRKGKRILVLDQWVPRFDRDSGSLRMSSILRILNGLGHSVTLVGDDLNPVQPYTQEFQNDGIEVIYSPFTNSVKQYLIDEGINFDLFVLSRPDVAIKYLDLLRLLYPDTKIIYDTVDLAFLRLKRRAELENDASIFRDANISKINEVYLTNNSDITFVVSQDERNLLLQECPEKRVEIVSNIHQVQRIVNTFKDRRDILFIGGFDHMPNIDAMEYFIKDIFPLVKNKLDVKIYIIGNIPSNHPAEEILKYQSSDIIITGYVKDITKYFENSRIFIAPLRYGAGVKGKINQSMSFGLPVITTRIGVEGINLIEEYDILTADNPVKFANQIIRLYNDEELWNKLSRNSIINVEKNFSYELATQQLRLVLGDLFS
jgi:O-antigen biosynthesis protein